mgnify:FL=1
MFYYIYGELTYRDAVTCVIDCGGVGYRMTVSRMTSDALVNKHGQRVRLYTYLAVRENEIELFGFGSDEERSCFNQLISVSGVGPRAAMSILSYMTPDAFSLAVCTEDIKGISKAPGVGSKTAARIVLELRDKISKDMMTAAVPGGKKNQPAPKLSGPFAEATEALMVLGYDRATVTAILRDVDPSLSDAGSIIKASLKLLSK